METWPRISIVTPSFNQARYIGETIESVLAQNYPNLEHIVVDGGSTDGTLEILRRYPHLKVICEPDRGQADAINKGFRLATGDIWGFLNSDDTLLPGALQRVAREIDPARGRHIVMGRCRFIDEEGRYLGIEHPSYFESHRRVLAIWKGHAIPQPAVFWTPEVWRTCGPMDESLTYHLDYDLFCRFSRKYRFHFIDQVLATYRLHPESKTEQWTEADRLEDSIRISRRYWGSPLSLTYWQLTFSLALYRFNRPGRARALFRKAQDAWRRHRFLAAIPYALVSGVMAPEVAFYVGIYPRLRDHTKGVLRRLLDVLVQVRSLHPQTAAYLEYADVWSDGWVGPRLSVERESGQEARAIVIRGSVELTYMSRPLVLTVDLDGESVGRANLEKTGDFLIRLPLRSPPARGKHVIDIRANTWFVPHRFTRGGDYRPLAWRFVSVEFEA